MPNQSNPAAPSPGTEKPAAGRLDPSNGRAACATQTVSPRQRAFLRTSEWLLVAYFILAAARAAMRGGYAIAALDTFVPLIFLSIEILQRHLQRRSIAIFRDWIPL